MKATIEAIEKAITACKAIASMCPEGAENTLDRSLKTSLTITVLMACLLQAFGQSPPALPPVPTNAVPHVRPKPHTNACWKVTVGWDTPTNLFGPSFNGQVIGDGTGNTVNLSAVPIGVWILEGDEPGCYKKTNWVWPYTNVLTLTIPGDGHRPVYFAAKAFTLANTTSSNSVEISAMATNWLCQDITTNGLMRLRFSVGSNAWTLLRYLNLTNWIALTNGVGDTNRVSDVCFLETNSPAFYRLRTGTNQ